MRIGTDPEFFIVDAHDKPVPAWRFFPPKEQKLLNDTRLDAFDQPLGHLFRDGYALEVNVSPETCRGRFANNVRDMVQFALSKHLPKGHKLVTTAAVKIDPADMADAPPDCQVFGCDPSLNAYTEKSGTVELDAFEHPYRYAGGHMHISSEEQNVMAFAKTPADKFQFIKLCDLLIGLPLAYIYDDEPEVLRRKYYGRAGECRFQEYPEIRNSAGGIRFYKATGVEYRTPSPRIWNNHRLCAMLFGVMRTIAANFVEYKKQWEPAWEPVIQKCINTGNVPYRLLQTVPGYYTPELLKFIKTKKHFQDFDLPTSTVEGHTAFGEWVASQFPQPNHYSMMGYGKAAWGYTTSGVPYTIKLAKPEKTAFTKKGGKL